MGDLSGSAVVTRTMRTAAHAIGAADPAPYLSQPLQRWFSMPADDPQYASNALAPGALPVAPQFSEREPNLLRVTVEPVCGGPAARRDEATREMRRLVGPLFGNDALRWFDRLSEDFRGLSPVGRLDYGAWFGTAYDADGLCSAEIDYELHPRQVEALPATLNALVRRAVEAVPNLVPVHTTISCWRDAGSQRVTFHHRGPLRVADLQPLMSRLGMAHQLPSVLQVIGLTLGGRFDLPEGAVLVELGETAEGPELKLEVLLGRLPDLPPGFLDLLTLGLGERPRELRALARWLRAFTPETADWPGNISVLCVRTTPRTPARVSLYLRPVEFELRQRLSNIPGMAPAPGAGVLVS